jgi:hypothetical protein
MVNLILLYIGAAFTIAWGVAHLVPTKAVVKGFGEISLDNQHILTMEWIVEGVALIFIGLIVAVVTFFDPLSTASWVVFMVSAIALLILALVSMFTGYKVKMLPFKLCPYIFTVSAILILAGGNL